MSIPPKIGTNAAVLIALGASVLSHSQPTDAQAAIYRCAGEHGVVYTGRPCESGADPHEVDDSRVTIYTPAPTAERASTAKSSKPAKAKAARNASPGRAADPDRQRTQCAKLDQGLRDVRTKMRTGYDVNEGERLRSRQRHLNQQRRRKSAAEV